MKKATLIKKISTTQEIWSSYYEFPSFGVSPRVFTVLQVTHYEPSSPRTGCVNSARAAPFYLTQLSDSLFISIPVDLTSEPELAKLEERGVKGRYVSVESLTELPSGKTEWRMATSSSPGGRIPALLVENTMASTISAVSISRWILVPSMVTWVIRTSHTSLSGSKLSDTRRRPKEFPLYQLLRISTRLSTSFLSTNRPLSV